MFSGNISANLIFLSTLENLKFIIDDDIGSMWIIRDWKIYLYVYLLRIRCRTFSGHVLNNSLCLQINLVSK